MVDKEKILNNIQIVLVKPQIPENIGLVARVLKNTGFKNFALVKPVLTEKAYQVAKRARDVLTSSVTHKTIESAVQGANFVFGASRRRRTNRFIFDFNTIKHMVVALAHAKRVSIIFGKEDFGLSNDDIAVCDSIFSIPADEHFPSYNVAFAVGIVCYELFNAIDSIASTIDLELAERKQYAELFAYMQTYVGSRLKAKRVIPATQTLQRLFLRTHLTKNEIALLKSLFIVS